MRIIGLTGGISSGKSSVAKMLNQLGAFIIDIDKLSREVVNPGEPAWHEIKRWLGPDILLADGGIDRKKLGEIVFNDPKARALLERITHPRIQAAVRLALDSARRLGVRVVVLDVPLLFEAGWEKFVDETWVVYADDKTQLARLMARDNLCCQQARKRIEAQMSLADKARMADIVIDNSDNCDNTKLQVEKAWRRIKSTLTDE